MNISIPKCAHENVRVGVKTIERNGHVEQNLNDFVSKQGTQTSLKRYSEESYNCVISKKSCIAPVITENETNEEVLKFFENEIEVAETVFVENEINSVEPTTNQVDSICQLENIMDDCLTDTSCQITPDTTTSKNNAQLNENIQNVKIETDTGDVSEANNTKSSSPIDENVNEFESMVKEIPKVVDRQIVDFEYIWSECQKKFPDCKMKDIKLVNKSNASGGLRHLFYFHCEDCDKKESVWSEDRNSTALELNEASVLAALKIGVGHAQVEEFLSTLHINYIIFSTFKKKHDLLYVKISEFFEITMKEAAKKEAEMAVKAGDVLKSGYPFTGVKGDGTYGKRSFGNQYNSLCGAAVLIGTRTGKILHMSVLNKHCATCYNAIKNNLRPPAHTCYRNFPRNKPSTLMETQGLLEGFRKSIEERGLVYLEYFGDGDNNFMTKLVNNNPYQHLNIYTRKIECTNHLLRNLCRKLQKVALLRQPRWQKRKVGFVAFRNLVASRYLKIRFEVTKAVDKRRAMLDTPWKTKVEELRRDILNIPKHVFGQHTMCHSRGLTCKVTDKTKNHVQRLKTLGFFLKIEEAVKFLSCHSDSLLRKETTNIVEQFNSQIAKTTGGKRPNLTQSNQYNSRCKLAGIHFNTEGYALTEIYRFLKKDDTYVKVLEDKRQKKVERKKKTRALDGRKKRHEYGERDENYGENCQQLDKTPDVIEKLKVDHYEWLKENQKNRVQIEIDTREQSDSDYWYDLRKKMITSSNFGPIAKKHAKTSCQNILKSITQPGYLDTDAMKYGRQMEYTARQELEQLLFVKIKQAGLIIDAENECIGTSVDGLIDDWFGLDFTVEIKCPLSAADITPEQAMETISHLKIIDKKTGKMKTSHNYYYQIQGQLHITRRPYCLFALRTNVSIHHMIIERDENFFKKVIEPKIMHFYRECLLMEILDSRLIRNMRPREAPEYQVAKDAFELKQKEKNKDNRTENSVNDSSKNEAVNEGVNESDSTILPQENDCNNDEICSNNNEKKGKQKRTNRKTVNSKTSEKQKNNDKAARRTVTNTQVKKTYDFEKDGVEVVSEVTRPWTEYDTLSVRQYLDVERTFSLDTVHDQIYHDGTVELRLYRNWILDKDWWLNDDVLDEFMRILKRETDFECQSVNYIVRNPNCTEPIKTNKSIQIIGGIENCRHWRTVFYDGSKIIIFDPLWPNYFRLRKQELQYLNLRYPTVAAKDISFVKSNIQQPDGSSCGVYAAAIATEIALSNEVQTVRLSKDPIKMRQHFVCEVLEMKTLKRFPREN